MKFNRRNSSTTADSPVKLQGGRGIFNINIAVSILQESRCQLSPNGYRSAGRNGKWLQDPFCGSAADTRLRTAIVETHNMKTLKPKDPLRSAATALLKWKRTLKVSSDDCLYVRDLVIVAADVSVYNSVRPSAGAALTTKLDIFSPRLCVVLWCVGLGYVCVVLCCITLHQRALHCVVTIDNISVAFTTFNGLLYRQGLAKLA